MKTVTLSVPDMTCGNCVTHVREALAGVSGLGACAIDLPRKQVRLEVDGPAALTAAQASLAEEGYPATVIVSA